MYEDIKKNKIKTGFIISLFIIVITLVSYYICNAFDLGSYSILFAVLISILLTWTSYFYSDKIILSLNRARPATHEQDQKLSNILDALVISSGLEYKPKLYVMDDPQLNAFATGKNPKNSVICVTTGLLDNLDYYELEGVIAHELAHVKNYDILLSAIVTVMVGLLVMLSDVFTRTMFYGKRDRDSDSKGNSLLMIIGLVLLILSPIFANLMKLALSRRREFLADSTAIQFTRNPDGLISALKKLDSDSHILKTANKATSHMYIVNPVKATQKRQKTSIMSTHPSIDDRIEALENLK
ncbi:MAG: M48 family metallopeptidase [Clostridia bacterium]|nr:M48 family metallopeptidase [Clostridia bacterium]